MPDKQIHKKDCWRLHTHHACAVEEIERLQAIVDSSPLPKDIEILRDANEAFAVENERLKKDLAGEKDNCVILTKWWNAQQRLVKQMRDDLGTRKAAEAEETDL